jgi:glycerol transport system substrate-binding protein
VSGTGEQETGKGGQTAFDRSMPDIEPKAGRREELLMTKPETSMRRFCLMSTAGLLMVAVAGLASTPAAADMAAAEKWVDEEFQPSTLSREDQLKEMEWFIKAAEPFKGMEIKVVSETIPTHSYESSMLTKAFEEITGIKVTHDLIQEGDVIEKLQTQLQSGENVFDAYVNDSDLIGTHFRGGAVVNLTDWMAGDGKDVTLPTLDVEDFIGREFTTGPDGKLYQLPDQQFANLYWFRYDWFQRDDFKAKFKEIYGYDLGVPVNWSAYEDIAEFFSEHVREIDGKAVYGHMDYGKKAPDLGWRFTDAWLSMAGAGDVGLPNGLPVDEWGIRVDGCRPVGATVSRGGAANGPAAKYALRKYMEWLRKYAPPGALGMDFYQSLPSLSKGNVAQQIFWYTAFTAAMVEPQEKGNNTVDAEGKPLWRMAPSPHGPYWEEGQKLGYQDAGSWTLLNSTPLDRRKAAWLFAQFTVSKTVSLKKSHVGLTIIRDSDINHESFSERAPLLGGLVEFYRSPARVLWTPSGTNVPDYPKLAQLWWQNIGEAVAGEVTVDTAMDNLAKEQDKVLKRLERAGVGGDCGPKLNEEMDEAHWLSQPGAPKAKLDNEKPQGITVDYDELIKSWSQN